MVRRAGDPRYDGIERFGGYASASEVVRAGLRALQERDEAIERWLREEVAPTFDAVKNGEVATHPADAVIGEIRNRPTRAES